MKVHLGGHLAFYDPETVAGAATVAAGTVAAGVTGGEGGSAGPGR